jgi:hypothetical protein
MADLDELLARLAEDSKHSGHDSDWWVAHCRRVREAAAAIASLREEQDALRQIISECATATGAGIVPTASLGFMRLLPGEISVAREAVIRERDEAREALKPFDEALDGLERLAADRPDSFLVDRHLLGALSMGDFRNAHKALSPTQKPGNGE